MARNERSPLTPTRAQMQGAPLMYFSSPCRRLAARPRATLQYQGGDAEDARFGMSARRTSQPRLNGGGNIQHMSSAYRTIFGEQFSMSSAMFVSTSYCATNMDDECASTESMPDTASPQRW